MYVGLISLAIIWHFLFADKQSFLERTLVLFPPHSGTKAMSYALRYSYSAICWEYEAILIKSMGITPMQLIYA